MISITGNELTILIYADYNIHQEWMAYASWYSAHRLLPDAEICISIPKPTSALFRWTAKAGIKQYRVHEAGPHSAMHAALASKISQPLLVIPAGAVAVRDLPDLNCPFATSEGKEIWFLNGIADLNDDSLKVISELCCSCTSYQNATFIQVKDTCGGYNEKTWLAKAKSSPFFNASRFKRNEMSPNEHAMINLWDRMKSSYSLLI